MQSSQKPAKSPDGITQSQSLGSPSHGSMQEPAILMARLAAYAKAFREKGDEKRAAQAESTLRQLRRFSPSAESPLSSPEPKENPSNSSPASPPSPTENAPNLPPASL